ncbi:MAG: ATP-binding protein, partial [Nitrobacter sp.]|uniref:ATP-binding protein n=1 Tax=Nitrobacter sp. TaxID=29420 RepID=UPI002634ABFD
MTEPVESEAVAPRPLSLTFTLGTLKHLGGQMYGGGIVKPVAELVANAWDADATLVAVTLPAPDSWMVVVADNGHGMTYEQCRDRYLAIGADRRQVLGSDVTASGTRKVMGRKGLGKLAVIQATATVEVDTVALDESGNPWRTHFRIPYGEFMAKPTTEESAQPIDVLDDGPPPSDLRFPGDSVTGTRTTLLDVRLSGTPNRQAFIRSMHTRFALAAETDSFTITVDGERVPTIEEAVESLAFEHYWAGTEVVPDVGEVTWWVGTTSDPQPRDELQGFALYARKRLAVERPFWFNLTRGFTGQLGKEYMTGAVYVDAIDEDEDLIATDRGTIDWSHEIGRALESWGQDLIRKHAKEWEELRGKRRIDELAPDPRLLDQIDRLSGRARDDCRVVLRSLARQPHATKDDLDRTATVLLNGLQHREFLETLQELTSTNVDELPGILAKWNVLEALLYLPVVRSRIEVIAKLRRL